MNKEKPSDEKLVPKQKKREINIYKYIVYALTLNTNVRFMVDILVARLDDKYFSYTAKYYLSFLNIIFSQCRKMY